MDYTSYGAPTSSILSNLPPFPGVCCSETFQIRLSWSDHPLSVLSFPSCCSLSGSVPFGWFPAPSGGDLQLIPFIVPSSTIPLPLFPSAESAGRASPQGSPIDSSPSAWSEAPFPSPRYDISAAAPDSAVERAVCGRVFRVLPSLFVLGAWDIGVEDCTFVRSGSSTGHASVQMMAHWRSNWERLESLTLASIISCRLGCCGGSPVPTVMFGGGAGIWRTAWYARVRPIRFFVNAT